MTTTRPTLSAADFAAKWRDNVRRERPSSQEHFINLCQLLGVQTPNEADPTGEWYSFEAGAKRTSTGGTGAADVWKRGFFGWEYKGAHADLGAAYRQLLDYREALENPPLLVVSDMDVIEVHTDFTNTKTAVRRVTLEDLAAGGERTAEALRLLRAVMSEPEALRPRQTPDEVTQLAAARFADIARSMQERGHEPEAVAHFLNRVLFCLFAEDVGLLPARLMTDLVRSRRDDPEAFEAGISELFRLMADRETGRFFGTQRIEWFDGGLFDDAAALAFTRDELRAVGEASDLDWSQVEPAILGTLFERGLDPDKRGQLGAHYTDREKILMVVEPVVLTPLRHEFAAMQARVEELAGGQEPSSLTLGRFPRRGRGEAPRRRARRALQAWERDAEDAWRAFLERLRAVRVLDPACGSGNFLYVTLRLLKDLEQEAIGWGADRLGIPRDGLIRWRIGRGAGRSACRAALWGPIPRFRGRSRPHSAAGSPARAIPDAALPRSRELRLGSQQVRETEQQRETLVVLLQAPVADLRVPEVPLHVEKWMLGLRTHRGLAPLRLCLGAARRQQPPETRAHRHLPAHLRTRVLRALLHSLVAGIAPHRALTSVQQAMRLGHVGDVRRRRVHAVDQPRPRIRAAVQLHPEVPLPALSGLVHLGVARSLAVLRRGRRADDRGVHDRALAQLQPLPCQMRVDRREQLRSQLMALQQVAEVEDRRLIGDRLGEAETGELEHRAGVVEFLLHAGVAEVEPELEAVDAQHHAQRVGAASAARLRVDGRDALLQLSPGDEPVHALQEPLAPCLDLLVLVLDAAERTLLHGAPLSGSAHDRIRSLAQASCSDHP